MWEGRINVGDAKHAVDVLDLSTDACSSSLLHILLCFSLSLMDPREIL